MNYFALALFLFAFNFGFGQEKFDNNPYYDLNEIHTFQNFEISVLQKVMIEYPHIKFEFTQYINPLEPKKIARKRMRSFKKQLGKANIDLKRLKFHSNIEYVKESFVNYPKSRISGVAMFVLED